jgi:hypothetical protein
MERPPRRAGATQSKFRREGAREFLTGILEGIAYDYTRRALYVAASRARIQSPTFAGAYAAARVVRDVGPLADELEDADLRDLVGIALRAASNLLSRFERGL